MARGLVSAAVLLVLWSPAALPVTAVDGSFEDWDGVASVHSDRTGDGEVIDLGRVWLRSDSERVTLSFEIGADRNLQGGNALSLYLDTDGDASTGLDVEGIGADFSWTFGERRGTLWADGTRKRVEQYDVGLIQAPTVSSTRFEVSFLRWTPELGTIIPGPSASIVLADAGGDRLPDTGALHVELSDEPPPPPSTVALERRSHDDIRVLSYNVLFDGLFKRPAPFVRLLRAIDPDVICFQEIWSHSARQAADQVSLAIPGVEWYGAHTTEGHVVSRYPFIEATTIDEAGNYWALVDLPDDRYDVDLSVVSAHPPCCDKEVERQQQLDGIAAWLRDLSAPGDPGTAPGGTSAALEGPRVAPGTPTVVAGDMNLVGGARQVRTLLEGAIVYEEKYGPSASPDWDGTPFTDADPRHAGGVENFTWRDSRSSFAPGKLDYIVYSDSVLRMRNAFVLATEELPPEVLERYGLRAGDTLEASDHLPVVADFAPIAVPPRASGFD